MSKQYGLILPGQQKKPLGRELPARDTAATKPSIFDESSASDGESSDDGRPRLSARKPPVSMGPGAMERRMARRMQEQALKEDPTVFQYDELYDEMESKREAEQEVKSKEPKKPKYIERLMVTAEKRKLENELRIERQVQKEREQEGEEFKDKEAFVTAAYRKKLEEMRKMQEDEKRDEYLEAIGDVTKQQNIDGFYRHLYEQKVGIRKEVTKPEFAAAAEDASKDEEEAAYKPIKSGKVPQQRAYRKRKSSDEEEEDPTVANTSKEGLKVHLQNNMDADSDFSIDSSTSESDDEESGDENATKDKTKKTKDNTKAVKPADDKSEIVTLDSAKIALNLDTLKKPKEEPEETKNENVKENEAISVKKEATPPPPPKPKIDKTLIWQKRTVGEVFDAAVQRYFERKAARSSA